MKKIYGNYISVLCASCLLAGSGLSVCGCGGDTSEEWSSSSAPVMKGAVDGVLPASRELVDSASYMLGINFGAMLKDWGIWALDEMNLAEVEKGILDLYAAKGKRDPYDEEYASQFKINLKHFERIINDYVNKSIAYRNTVTGEEGRKFLADNAMKANVDTTSSGLQYTIVEEGASDRIQSGDTVVINYQGQFVDGTVFEKSDSATFSLSQVIKGWQEGLGLVGEGGKLKLYVPFKLGYGKEGTYHIPGFATLIYDMEVLEVRKCNSEK